MRRLSAIRLSAALALVACGGSDATSIQSDAPPTTADAPMERQPDAAVADAGTAPDASPLPDGASSPDAAPTAATLTVAPPSFDFGAVVVEDKPSKTFTVTASGGPPDATLAVTVTGDPAFRVGPFSKCPGKKLSAGDSCTIDIVFAPTASGAASAVLHIDGDLAGDGVHLTVPLGGTGVTSGALTATPEELSFAPVVVGGSDPGQTVTVKNTGQTDTGPISVSVTGSDAASFQVTNGCTGATLAPDASCTFSVSFAPTAAGDLSARVAISAVPGGTATVAVDGHGQAPAHLTGGGAHVFGPIAVGTTQSFDYTITNDGEVPTGTLVKIANGDVAIFMTHSSCPTSLAANTSCTVTVTYAPIAPEPSHLHIAISASPGGMVAIDASGTAFTLSTLTVAPHKHVTVTSLPAGIDCGEACAASYPTGAKVALDAIADSNATTILGWRGDCDGIDDCATTNTSCTVTMTQSCDASPIVGAELLLKRAGLGRILSNPEGIDCGGIGPRICDMDSASFEVNSTVVLKATSGPGGPPLDDATWKGCKEDTGPTCTVDIPPDGTTVEYSCVPPCGISVNP